MKFTFILPALLLALSTAACVRPDNTASRSAAPVAALATGARFVQPDAALQPVAQTVALNVQQVRVAVPQSLEVSEANSFLPKADIVWRGEPLGNRHAQVTAIFQEAMGRGTARFAEGRAVIVDVEVTRFHCLTEKTRYSVGGVHSMQFVLTLRDAATGQVISTPREVIADVRASGGSRAISEDLAGRTQRVVVVERLAEVIARELSTPMALRPSSPQDLLVARADIAAN